MVLPLLIGLLGAILGLTSASIIPRPHYGIYGGVPASIFDFPHQAFLRVKHRTIEFCGGSIISNRHILTAAHCFYYYRFGKATRVNPNIIEVGVGTDNLLSNFERHEIGELTIHDNFEYYQDHSKNDVAVVKLDKAIIFTDKVKKIALAKPGYVIRDGTELIVTGWGKTENLKAETRLRKVNIPKLSSEECHNDYGSRVTDSNICAGTPGRDTCERDSGGALILETSEGNLQVGITGWGDGCAEEGHPGVYTEISKYYKWIESIVTKH